MNFGSNSMVMQSARMSSLSGSPAGCFLSASGSLRVNIYWSGWYRDFSVRTGNHFGVIMTLGMLQDRASLPLESNVR